MAERQSEELSGVELLRGWGRRREVEWRRERSVRQRWQDQVFETRDVDGKRSDSGAKDST